MDPDAISRAPHRRVALILVALAVTGLAAVTPADAHAGSWSGQFNAAIGITSTSFGPLFWETSSPMNGVMASVVVVAPTYSDGRHRIRVSRSSSTSETELAIQFRVTGGPVPPGAYRSSGGTWEGVIPRNADRMVVYGGAPTVAVNPPAAQYQPAAMVSWTASVVTHL